jgi:hypothetical protein
MPTRCTCARFTTHGVLHGFLRIAAPRDTDEDPDGLLPRETVARASRAAPIRAGVEARRALAAQLACEAPAAKRSVAVGSPVCIE